MDGYEHGREVMRCIWTLRGVEGVCTWTTGGGGVNRDERFRVDETVSL